MAVSNLLNELTSAMNGLQLTSLSEQLRELRLIQDSLRATEMPPPSRTSATTPSGGSGRSWLSTVGSFLGGGFGVASLISGVSGLFGGSENASAPPLVYYSRPGAIHAEGAVSAASRAQVIAADSGQGGLSRAMTTAAQPQITVQVQAFDSRSFLDHSNEIALAVRQAMLETSVLNDVIREV